MPRPRFEKLDEERRRSILGVAAAEFAEHGYEGASYNRIIERSGLSKGATYYYFDDKQDLYATVLRDAMQRLVVDVGDVGSAKDASGFWNEFEAWYRRSIRSFQQEPHAVGLARGLVKALARGAATSVLAELRQHARGWMEGVIAHGQRVRAIRTDLPPELLFTVLMALEEGIDLWLGERIGELDERAIDEAAVMLTRLYRRLAEASDEEPKTKRTKAKRRAREG